MEGYLKIIIFLLALFSVTSLLTHQIYVMKKNAIIKEKNQTCYNYGLQLSSLGNYSKIESCFCYYFPCSPSENVWDKTKVSCVCNCTLEDNSKVSVCINILNK